MPALTTCSAAHISGMNVALPAASVSFSSRNASVELPSVNRVRTTMNEVNARGRGSTEDQGRTGIAGRQD